MALRGFDTWRPTEESAAILAAVNQVFRDYRQHLPLTGRQVFYRLVGAYGYLKSEAAANKLYGILGRARRSGMIDFEMLRDGGGQVQLPQTFADESAFWAGVRDDFDHYSRDRQRGQPLYVELFCEAPGMMPQLVRAAFPYSVPVYGTRGFTGLSVIQQIAKRALMRDVSTVILQVGDLDPSGVSIFESMTEDAAAFVRQAGMGLIRGTDGVLCGKLGVPRDRIAALREGAFPRQFDLAARRIAITWEQVQEHDLPTAPPSSKDSRSRNWPYPATAQAEALPPDLLARIVQDSIEDTLDIGRYHEELDAEAEDRTAIEERLPE
jgi:hypothetical protein